MVDLFKDSTSKIPKSDPQIVRVDMEQQDVGGRKSHLPAQQKADKLTVSHTPNAGNK